MRATVRLCRVVVFDWGSLRDSKVITVGKRERMEGRLREAVTQCDLAARIPKHTVSKLIGAGWSDV